MADRYYVGGNNSYWDVTSSWATTSGGTPGASVPTSTDNIYFDVNSGLQASSHLNTSGALNCHNVVMTQGGNLGIGTGSSLLNIYGSASFQNLVSPPIAANFYGSGAQTIQSVNSNLGYVLAIYGGSISLLLQNNVVCVAFEHYGGTVDLNGYNLTSQAVLTSGTTPGVLYLRTGTVTCSSTFEALSTAIMLVPGTATIVMSGSSGSLGMYSGAPALYSVISQGGLTFTSFNGAITTLQLARGSSYAFTPGATWTITNPIRQSGIGTTTLAISSGSSNFTLSSPVQQYLSNTNLANCTAAGAGSPFLAVGSSVVTSTCIGWIKPKAIGFAGD